MPPKIVVEVIADPRAYVTGLRAATAETGMFAKNVERMGRGTAAGTLAITGMGRAIAFASAQFLGGYGLAFALAHSAKAAAEFQQQMLLIRTQAGDTSGDIKQLSQAVLDMSVGVGTTPDQLAKGLYHIESAGVRGKEALKTLHVAAMGAKIGMDDLENVTNALVAAQQSGLKGTKDMTQAMGELDAITGAGNLRLEDLTKALHSGVTGTAREVGISLTDLGSAIATLTIQGVPAQQAATRLRTSFALLAAPTKQATKELKSIGITQLELAHIMRTQGLIPALQDLQTHLRLSGRSPEAQTATIVRAFGAARSSATIIQLLQHLDTLKKSTDRITTGAALFGDKWHQETQTAAFHFDQFKAAIQRTEIVVGNALLPALTHAAEATTKWLSKPENQKALSDAVKNVTGLVVGLVKVIKDAVKALSPLVDGVKTLFDAMGVHMNKLETVLLLLFTVKMVKWYRAWATRARDTSKAVAESQAAAATQGAAATSASAEKSIAATQGAAKKEMSAAAEVEAAFKASNSAILADTEAKATASAAAWEAAAAAATTAAETSTAAATGGMGMLMMRGTVGGRTSAELGAEATTREAQIAAARQYTGFPMVAPGVTRAGSPLDVTSAAARERASQEAYAAYMAQGLPAQGPPPTPGRFARFRAGLSGSALGMGMEGEGGVGMAARAGAMVGALPTAITLPLFGVLAYDMTSMALKATHADTALKKLGSGIAELTGHAEKSAKELNQGIRDMGKGAPNIEKTISLALMQMRPEDITPRKVPMGSDPFGLKGLLGIHDTRDIVSQPMKDLRVELKAKFHLSDHDIDVFLKAVQNRLDTSRQDLSVEVTPKVAHGKAMVPKQVTPADLPQGAVADFLTRLQLQEATAREQIAAGDNTAKERLVALLKQQIAFDEKWYKRQEDLYKKGGQDAQKHMKTMIKLREDEASAYQEITSLQQKSFELPKSLQLTQAAAGVTQSTADDISVAKQIVALAKSVALNTKKSIDERISAYQAWQSALTTIQQAKTYQIPQALQLAQLAAQLTLTNEDDRKVAQKIADNARAVAMNTKRSFADRQAAYQALIGARSVLDAAPPIPMKLQIAQARAATTQGQQDDINAAKAVKAWAQRMIKTGKFKNQAMIDLLNIIASANQQIGEGGQGRAMYIATNPRAMTEGLGLSLRERRAMETRIAEAEAHGGRRPRAGAMGVEGYGVQTTNNYTFNIHGGDPMAVEAAVMRVIQRRNRHNPPTRRNGHGGTGA